MNTVISSCRQGRILSGNLVLLAGRLVRDYIQVSINELNAFLTGIFEQYGFGHADAGFITSTLIDADQRGIASHGVQRMSMYDHKLRHHMITPQAHAVVISDVKACAVVDGNSGMGQLISRDAMNLAIAKARTHGVGIVSVRNSNHFGTAGFYARMAADQGFIGVASTNSNPLTVPTHAQSPAIGSNPIAFAVGSGSDQIVYDAATSTVSLGKIELLAKLDKPIEGEWALSENGSVEHSADAVMERMHAEPRTGGLTPLGGAGELNAGYKGYGLGLIVEILTAILSSGTLSLNMHGQHICHCFAAINAEAFGGARRLTNESPTSPIDCARCHHRMAMTCWCPETRNASPSSTTARAFPSMPQHAGNWLASAVAQQSLCRAASMMPSRQMHTMTQEMTSPSPQSQSKTQRKRAHDEHKHTVP
jgi:LDH2 family malate/lactate/ureidoglycolate dehydrogenase